MNLTGPKGYEKKGFASVRAPQFKKESKGSIFEGNSEYIVYKKQRVQSVDCKVMSILFEDVLR